MIVDVHFEAKLFDSRVLVLFETHFIKWMNQIRNGKKPKEECDEYLDRSSSFLRVLKVLQVLSLLQTVLCYQVSNSSNSIAGVLTK